MKHYILWSVFLFLFAGCHEQKETKNLGEAEFYFNERLSSISAENDSVFWLGGENGDIWQITPQGHTNYSLNTDRIYKVASDTLLEQTPICWIGIRNSGLQKWKLQKGDTRQIDVFPIPHKQYNYSVYDIIIHDTTVYTATSQGLYAMSRSGNERLCLIYPDSTSETACAGKPFIINNLQRFRNEYLLCATQNGMVKMNLATHQVKTSHESESILNLYVEGDDIYILANKVLYIEDINGKQIKKVNLDFTSRIYYKQNDVHYFIDNSHLIISNDLQHFTSVTLRRKTPQDCSNIIATNRLGGTILLVLENALWNIPQHLSFFYTNGEIIASCTQGNEIYYINSKNELFHQYTSHSKAIRVMDLPDDEIISNIMTDGEYLYYISNKQFLKKVKIRKEYLGNSVAESSEILYQSPTKITASYLQQTQSGNRIYLGIQDNLVIIHNLKANNITYTLDNRYITAFYSAPGNDNLYISTLNNGIYYGHNQTFRLIQGTEDAAFIRDITVTEGHNPLLMILTNHHLIGKEYNDTVKVKGCHKILTANDSTFYVLPESGLLKYTVRKNRIEKCGSFFQDICFSPKASLIINDTLFLGSNTGIMRIKVDQESTPQWIDISASVPNTKMILITTAFIILLTTILIVEYFKREHGKKKIIRIHIDDIADRLESLSAMIKYTNEQDKHEVETLRNAFNTIDINSKYVLNDIKVLSERIMKKNRDMALTLSKHLDLQIQQIGEQNAFEKEMLIRQSLHILSSNNLESIAIQVETNEKWIKDIKNIQERLNFWHDCINATIDIEPLTGIIHREINLMTEDIGREEVAVLKNRLTVLSQHFEHLFTQDALQKIDQYLQERQKELQSLDHDSVTHALYTEIEHVRGEMESQDRIKLLRLLYPIDCHISQLLIKDKMARLIKEYTIIRQQTERENEERITPKFGTNLSLEIAEKTRHITGQIEKCICDFYESMQVTDKDILLNVLEFSTFNNQSAKVLALLVANPKVKRLYLPGILCLYGNMNPVISRLNNNKLKTNREILNDYVRKNPTSIVYYISRLASQK